MRDVPDALTGEVIPDPGAVVYKVVPCGARIVQAPPSCLAGNRWQESLSAAVSAVLKDSSWAEWEARGHTIDALVWRRTRLLEAGGRARHGGGCTTMCWMSTPGR